MPLFRMAYLVPAPGLWVRWRLPFYEVPLRWHLPDPATVSLWATDALCHHPEVVMPALRRTVLDRDVDVSTTPPRGERCQRCQKRGPE